MDTTSYIKQLTLVPCNEIFLKYGHLNYDLSLEGLKALKFAAKRDFDYCSHLLEIEMLCLPQKHAFVKLSKKVRVLAKYTQLYPIYICVYFRSIDSGRRVQFVFKEFKVQYPTLLLKCSLWKIIQKIVSCKCIDSVKRVFKYHYPFILLIRNYYDL